MYRSFWEYLKYGERQYLQFTDTYSPPWKSESGVFFFSITFTFGDYEKKGIIDATCVADDRRTFHGNGKTRVLVPQKYDTVVIDTELRNDQDTGLPNNQGTELLYDQDAALLYDQGTELPYDQDIEPLDYQYIELPNDQEIEISS